MDFETEALKVWYILGAMRQYCPSDLLPKLNEAIVEFSAAYSDEGRGLLQAEGNGWTDETARESIARAMRYEFTAVPTPGHF